MSRQDPVRHQVMIALGLILLAVAFLLLGFGPEIVGP